VVENDSTVAATAGGPAFSDPDPVADAQFLGWQRLGDPPDQQYDTAAAKALPIYGNTTFTALYALTPPPSVSFESALPVLVPEPLVKPYDGTVHHNPLRVTYQYPGGDLAFFGDEDAVPPVLYIADRFIIPFHANAGDPEPQGGLENRTDVAANDQITFIYVISDIGGGQVITIPQPVALTITPRLLAPAAVFPNIMVGDPGPVFNSVYYAGADAAKGFSLDNLVDLTISGGQTDDTASFTKKSVQLFTPYTQGQPAGTYGIYARAGYYDRNGNFVGETVAAGGHYVNGGNYEISGNPAYLSDADRLLFLDAAGNIVASSTPNAQQYVKIGAFNVSAPSQPPGGGGGGGGGGSPSPFVADHIQYIFGYPDGKVKPERSLSRAEAAAVFFRLLTDDYRQGILTYSSPFSDVQSGDWYGTVVASLAKSGVVSGYPGGAFRPNDFITRAELSAIAVRFAAIMNETGEIKAQFSDVAGSWAEESIYKAAEIGWIGGYPDGTFQPDSYISRAEFVAIVNRMLARAPETEDDLLPDTMKKWPDNSPGQWYYLDIQEATNSHQYLRKTTAVPNRSYNYEKWTEIIGRQ
jgi:hypothetical protein